MTTITTTDGFVFVQLADGTYTDGDDVYTEHEITSNGHDSDASGWSL